MLNELEARGRVGARDTILVGPRGIGKTATVLEFGDLCRQHGYEVINLQAATGNSRLTENLSGQAQSRIQAGAGPWQRARRIFDQIAAVNLTVAGTGGGITRRDSPPAPPAVGPNLLAGALARLADEVRADAPHGGVLITVDEMQVSAAADLALLAAALHRLNADEASARVLFAGTGLPNMSEVLRTAGVTHPDRLLHIRHLPLNLSEEDALFAIVKPAQDAGVSWDPEAARLVVNAINGYPAHLQLFADHAWKAAAPGSGAITIADAEHALVTAAAELEERTLEPRLERLNPRQAELLTALAINGGQATRAQVTATLERDSADSFSRTRAELIAEGDIYSRRRGDLTLTVPLFGRYLLANYEDVRARATTRLLPLEAMQRNAGAYRGSPALHGTISPAPSETGLSGQRVDEDPPASH